MLGCNPSQNVYGMLGEGVFDARKLRYRFAGGHIHLGYRFEPKKIESLVKLLDAILGVWSVGAAAKFDNPIRRKYYGLAGEYRLPEHGLEYRTLSNFWLAHPGLANLVLMLARAIFSFHNDGLAKEWIAHPQEVIETINNCDVRAARKILQMNHKVLETIFSHMRYAKGIPNREVNPQVQQALRIGQEGLESVIDDPNDFVKNWKLDSSWHGHCDGKMESWKDLCQPKIELIAA